MGVVTIILKCPTMTSDEMMQSISEHLHESEHGLELQMNEDLLPDYHEMEILPSDK